jgi:hypothetical protein
MSIRAAVCVCVAIVVIAVMSTTRHGPSISAPPLGFVILRHVSSDKTDQYWKRCYDSIRALYEHEPILIIDDSVDKSHVSPHETHNTTVIDSEYTGRGELLPYIYYFRHKISERAVFLHDSVFLTRRVPYQSALAYQHLWNFETERFAFNPESEAAMLASCDAKLLPLYADKGRWKGCFGCMTVIRHDLLSSMHQKYDIMSLTALVKCRSDRMAFERAVACILRSLVSVSPPAVYGDIHAYCPWGITFENAGSYVHLPAIKVWTSR